MLRQNKDHNGDPPDAYADRQERGGCRPSYVGRVEIGKNRQGLKLGLTVRRRTKATAAA
jgi:hypothetical protein